MLGYWDDAERTAQAIDRAGWMHTGDLATIDAEGYCAIVGRIKDMVIRGGENVYPREIEEFLYRHPKIMDVQVFGVPDEKFGEEICAWIKLRAGETMDAEEVRAFCRDQIAYYKVPRHVRFVHGIPDDGDRQDAEIPDARGDAARARDAGTGAGVGRRHHDLRVAAPGGADLLGGELVGLEPAPLVVGIDRIGRQAAVRLGARVEAEARLLVPRAALVHAVFGKVEVDVDRLVRLDVAEHRVGQPAHASSACMNMAVCDTSRVSRCVNVFFVPSSVVALISAS